MIIKEEKPILTAVGSNIKKARAQKNIAQNKLASLLGLQKASMSRIEAGLTNVPVFALYNIAVALDIELHVLFNDLPQLSPYYLDASLNRPLFEKFTQYSNLIVEMNKKFKSVMDAALAETDSEKRSGLYTEGRTILETMANTNLKISRLTRIMYS